MLSYCRTQELEEKKFTFPGSSSQKIPYPTFLGRMSSCTQGMKPQRKQEVQPRREAWTQVMATDGQTPGVEGSKSRLEQVRDPGLLKKGRFTHCSKQPKGHLEQKGLVMNS